MTVLRADDGRLVLWSPVAMTAAHHEALRALGEVRTLVAPNAFHHVHLAAAVAAFPGARVVGVPGHEKKRPDVRFDLLVDRATPESALADVGLQGDISAIPTTGWPMVNELVAVHRPSGTAVVTDMVFHIREAPNAFSRWFWWLDGVWQRAALPRTMPVFLRDRAAFDASLEQVLAHPWDRLVMAHGEVLHQGGRAPLEAWLARGRGRRALPSA
jgi:hypothetical protein